MNKLINLDEWDDPTRNVLSRFTKVNLVNETGQRIWSTKLIDGSEWRLDRSQFKSIC